MEKFTDKFLLVVICGLLVVGPVGCAKIKQITQPAGQKNKIRDGAFFPPYSGLKAKIIVADFEVRATKANNGIGAGLREMLIADFVKTNRFSVVECQESAAGADLIITIAVTEFEPQASGGRAGIGGGGGPSSGLLGGLLGNILNKSHVALNIRIVDILTSKVLASKTVTGQVSDVAGNFAMESVEDWTLGGRLSAYANTPMEKAIHICIIEAVRYISQTIPTNYYKY